MKATGDEEVMDTFGTQDRKGDRQMMVDFVKQWKYQWRRQMKGLDQEQRWSW